MSGAFMKNSAPSHCGRCGRKIDPSAKDAGQWIVNYSAGIATDCTCPNCQTSVESQEADANLPKTKGSKQIILGALGEKERLQVVLDGAWKRAAAVVSKYKDLAKMAGETSMAVNVEVWAEEALRGWPLMDGMPEHFWEAVRPIVQDDIREMLGMK